MSADLRVELAGVSLRNPTILASGILGSSYGLMRRVELAGAGAITTKTITKDPREGYPNPVFVDLGFGYLNAMGLPNPGVRGFEPELRKAKAELRIPIIASVGGRDEAEFQNVAERLLDAGCDGIELNLSCPHVRGYGLEIGSDIRLASRVIKAVKGISSKPVFAKISIFQARREIIERYLDSGIDGVAAINTVRAMAISVESLTPILSNEVGGLSGPCIKPIALAAIYELHKEFPDIPLIGVGGVDSWKSGLEFILAGATAIGIGSAIAKKDLKIFEETVDGLKRFLSMRGFKSIRELIGYAHKT
ncbi:MAG: dihydroorotate dehydrogenase [Thaumarchaeota archaeon]|nr:MAG: dihydroorotate dehydrogenase [Nitrososphaerota archaeon]